MKTTLIAIALLASACAHRATVQLPAPADGSAPTWVELPPGMELRIEGAYFREGAPRTSRADYLGAQTVRYAVTPSGALQRVALSSFVTGQPGKTQPRDQPAVDTLVRPRALTYRHQRLFFQVVMSRNGTTRPAVLLGARSESALDCLTQQFLSDGKCVNQCTAFPSMITTAIDIGITINGKPNKVIWGTQIAALPLHTAKTIELKRLTSGTFTSIQIDPSDPGTARTQVLNGDEITWQ